jgi:excisionase family DNA binding protein
MAVGMVVLQLIIFLMSFLGMWAEDLWANFTKVKDYRGGSILTQIMTTKEIAKYLKLHQITICKLSKEGKIPAIQIGRVWRFDKEVIDEWIAKG